MKKVLLLMNETSGRQNNHGDSMQEIVTLLSQKNCLVTVYPINPNLGLISEAAFETDLEEYDVIACCGGDGTLNHVMSEMMKHGVQKPIGYIPSGTTNDFSKNLNGGKTLSVEEYCDIIAGNHVFTYDVGQINDSYFNYIAAFGAFTKVSYDTPQNWKNLMGYGAYVLSVIGNIPEGLSYRNYVKLKYDGMEEEGDFIFGGVANTLRVGGVESPLIQNAELNDGKFEVILINAPNNLIDVNEIINKLLSGSTDDKHLKMITTDHIEFTFEKETNWTIDGELGKFGNTVVIDNRQKAMTILVKE